MVGIVASFNLMTSWSINEKTRKQGGMLSGSTWTVGENQDGNTLDWC